ncbi:hypothetical protein MRX96_030221 [Rhipicephalus microplus]
MAHHHHGDGGDPCGGHGGDSSNGLETGVQYSLYSKIDLDNVECLNEKEEGSGKLVFKPWEQRLDREKASDSCHPDDMRKCLKLFCRDQTFFLEPWLLSQNAGSDPDSREP